MENDYLRLIINSMLILIMGVSTPLFAQKYKQSKQLQSIAEIKSVVKNYIYRNTTDLSGEVSIKIGNIDRRITLPKCEQLEPFVPTGSRLWGKTSIGVRCAQPAPWTIYVKADIQVMAGVLHIAQQLIQNQPLTKNNILLKKVDLTKMQKGIFTDPNQVIGKIPKMNINAGQPIFHHMLRDPYVILRGQKVTLQVKGRGFSVNSDGQALADAAEGQVIQVRNHAKRIISGIARHNAIVEVLP